MTEFNQKCGAAEDAGGLGGQVDQKYGAAGLLLGVAAAAAPSTRNDPLDFGASTARMAAAALSASVYPADTLRHVGMAATALVLF